jgi:hypothetical protein
MTRNFIFNSANRIECKVQTQIKRAFRHVFLPFPLPPLQLIGSMFFSGVNIRLRLFSVFFGLLCGFCLLLFGIFQNGIHRHGLG